MANVWTELSNLDEDALGFALSLLQRSLDGYSGLSLLVLQRKMRPVEKPPGTRLFCLRVFSYGEPANLNDPLVSAFFFLRRVHRPMGENKPWAYCLSVGAKAETNHGLDPAGLRSALVNICNRMRPLAHPAKLEVMHASPVPSFKVDNLVSVFGTVSTNTNPPMLRKHMTPGPNSTEEMIIVEAPWTQLPDETLKWLEIVEQ
jgi:hypothetical protein